REDAFAGLRVVDGASGKIAADGHANDSGRGPGSAGAPAHQRQLVTKLVHGGPDVVEELDFHHGFNAAHGHAHGAADYVGLGQRRIEDSVRAKLRLERGGELEDAAFALDQVLAQVVLAGAIRHVLAKDEDARVAAHFILQAKVDE